MGCSGYTSPSLSRNASFVSNRSSYISDHTPGHSTQVRRKVSCRKQTPGVTSQKVETSQSRTVTTLMGGRGYIQWRSAHLERHKTSHLAQINNSDAYLVIWDHKL